MAEGGGTAEGDEPDRRGIWQRLEEQDREEAARTKGFRLAFFSWLGAALTGAAVAWTPDLAGW